jgi:3-hydroxyisobutyrate dehydrogenase-like beta-hydroxyacid dehydrogenase
MRLGFIGLGVMGAPMALNLLKAGWEVSVNDIRPEAAEPHLKTGATWAESPREIAEMSDIVFSCLPEFSAIETVALGPNGVLSGAKPGLIYFETSTNTLDSVRRLHTAFKASGASMLDAPISGGAAGAKSGRLAMWVGGEVSAFDCAKPILDSMADQVSYVGASGSGLITKLVHNCSSQAMQAALAEVFSMGVKAGAEPLALWQAIRKGALGRRRTFDGLVDEFLPANYDDNPSATLRIVYKDTMAATALGREVGAPMPFANMALSGLQECMNRGWAERDARSVMLLPQERAGVAIKVKASSIQAVLDADPPASSDPRRAKT